MDKETLYARWLSGDLSQEEYQDLKESGALKELEKITEVLDTFEIPAYDKTKGLKQFETKHKTEKTKSRIISLKTISLIAAAALLIVAGLFLFKNEKTEVKAALASQKVHTLPDHSSVILNAGSSIHYDEKKWEQARILDLEGEAYFKVEKGLKFIVHTKNGDVEVLGTSFNMRSWGEDLYVECYSGRVRVEGPDDFMILIKGEAIKIEKGTLGRKLSLNNSVPTWQEGLSKFMNTNVTEVLNEIGRQYNMKVIHQIKGTDFSGSFVHNNIEEALKQVCKPMNLEWTIDKNANSVTIEMIKE